MPIEQHYTGREVADLLRLDYETVLHLAQVGEIASIRVGRLRRFPESAVRAYLDEHRESANSDGVPRKPAANEPH